MKSIKRLFLALTAILALTAFSPLAATAPSKPGLVSPINKAVQVDPAAVTLKWNKSTPSSSSSPIVSYDIEVSTSSAVDGTGAFLTTVNPADTEPAPVPVTSTVSHLVPVTLNYGTTYYWHVRADDGTTTSAWSAIGVFRVAVEPPTIVPLAAPDLLTLRPTFKWSPGAQSADSYTIQISMDSGFSPSTIYRTATILYSAIPGNQYLPTTDLTFSTLFHWRVRANNSALGTSAWSTVGDFTTANPPTVPVLVSPSGAKVSPTPKLTWKQVSLRSPLVVPGDFGNYKIEIFDTKTDIDTITPKFFADDVVDISLGDITTTSYTVPVSAGLLSSTTYYWRLKAYNATGEYSTSSLFTFYTTIDGQIASTTMDPSETLGNVPGLQGPSANSKVIPGFGGTMGDNINLLTLRPTFKWDAGPMTAETFTLQVAAKLSGSCNVATPQDSTFATTIINVTISSSDSEYAANLDKYPGYILCWRIRGNHSLYGSSEWSDVQIFLTATPPSMPVITAPVDGTLTNDASPEFDWGKVSSTSTFAKYEVEISFSSGFKGYDYPDTVPPYSDTVAYPIADLIMPGLPVLPPVYAVTPPASAFPNIPMLDQAHDADSGNANTISQPWYQVEDPLHGGGDELYGAHTYYYRVRAYNQNGEYSTWSVARSIKITPDRPTNLRLTDCAVPAPGATITDPVDPRPCFEWDKVYGANRYTIIAATKDNFAISATVFKATTTNLKYQPVVDLPKDQTIFWRVTATSISYGSSLPSFPAESFTSANPPSTPKLLAPPLNKLEDATSLDDFVWSPSYVPFGTTFDHYDVETSLANGSIVDSGLTASGVDAELNTIYTIAPGVLAPAKTYYWRVRGCNDAVPNQCSSWSTAFYFRTAIEAPTLITPPNDASPYSVLRPLFQWHHVNYATGYTIRISKSPLCDTAVVTANTSIYDYDYQPSISLSAPPYYWCVRANSSSYGPSPWSTIETYP